jgi:prepilin-type N-terminal cleavage/methylation domain-containing protein
MRYFFQIGLKRSIRYPIRSNSGFSLPELLVVIAVIIILITLLLPGLDALRERADRLQCLSQIRQIGISFVQFASDHDGHIPASTPARKPIGEEFSMGMLGKEIMPIYGAAPFQPQLDMSRRWGALIEYLGGRSSVQRLFRCPSNPHIETHSQVGSNGLFDYCMAGTFNGAILTKLPRHCVYVDRSTRQIIGRVMTPLLVEESPERLNWFNNETEWQNVDEPATWHRGDFFNFVTVEGSGHSMRFDPDHALPRVREFFTLPDYYPVHPHCGWGTWPCQNPRDPSNLHF